MENCKHFNSCNAPICPLYGNEKNKAIWYPDEDICKLKKFATLQWIKNQKKIKRKKDKTTYYTVRMLNRNFVIGPKIKGLDPDKEEEIQIKKWMKKHPEKKPLSEKKKKELRKRLLKIIEKKVETKR